jgi:hypothetical protein
MHYLYYLPQTCLTNQGEVDALAFWEAGECLTDFPDATHDEQWERNQKVPILYSLKELELYVSPAGRPPSPTPSFVRYFEGQSFEGQLCDCKQCMPNGPIHYGASRLVTTTLGQRRN